MPSRAERPYQPLPSKCIDARFHNRRLEASMCGRACRACLNLLLKILADQLNPVGPSCVISAELRQHSRFYQTSLKKQDLDLTLN